MSLNPTSWWGAAWVWTSTPDHFFLLALGARLLQWFAPLSSMKPLVYNPEQSAELSELASCLGLAECGDWSEDRQQQYLFYRQGALSLGLSSQCREHPVCVDFSVQFHSRQRGKELLLKAIGGRRQGLNIIDATAGLGRDGFLLASYGAEVQLCERNPVVAAMLADGLQRAQAGCAEVAAIAAQMALHSGSAIAYLQALGPEHCPDIVYLDPMFPDSGKSALVKKEMRLFHSLVGPDQDEQQLLQLALEKARYRVVVKRPPKAPVIGGEQAAVQPQLSFAGKAVRFDVYPLKAFPKAKS